MAEAASGGGSGTALRLVGRDAELAAIDQFLETVGDGFAALLLEGEAGIGKTALWLEGVAAARDRGLRVLTTRPAEAEATFSFAGLGDLADEALEEARPHLPKSQQEALDVALLRAPARRRRPDTRVVAVAVLGMLRALARSGPTVLAVDDIQWLDGASSTVLQFALRRLDLEPVRLLATLRGSGSDLTDALDTGTVHRLAINPLSVAALHHILLSRLGLSLPRGQLLRIHEASEGNPFFALELGRALLQQGPAGSLQDQLPVPEKLGGLVRGHLAGLSTRDREVLVYVAAMGRPTLTTVESGLPARLNARAALRRADEAGVISFDGERIRLAHPLLGSVLYADASARERRRVHRRLAAAVTDLEERGRHLALAAEGPDADVAAALDRAAEQAHSRGASGAAASLCRHALRLTPAASVADGWRRSIQAAEYHFQAGQSEEARTLLEELIASMPAGRTRAEALWRLGRVRREGSDFSPECMTLFRQALAEGSEDLGLRARILNALAWSEYHDHLAEAAGHADEAVEAAEEAGDLGELANAQCSVVYVDERPSWVWSVSLIYHDRLDEARRHIRSFIDEALDRGEENALPTLRFHLTWLESLAGNWREAEEEAERGYEEAIQTQQVVAAARILHEWAFAHAFRGRLELARGEARESLSRLQDQGQPELVKARAHAVLGFIALSEGDPRAAVSELGPLPPLLRRAGVGEPGAYRFAHDLAEAYVLTGELEAAETVVGELEEQGRRLDRAYALATGARCRGMVLAARGDVDGAVVAFEGALVEHERLPQPFELGRTLLALGQTQRRRKLRREGRATLERALGMFERLGAPVWADHTRAELARIGGRAPGATALTPTEDRVATLAAEGLTNREIAERMFISVKTVEGSLSRVYRKLEVRSRTELATRLHGLTASL